MLYGYARVSTQGQRLERQIRNIEAYAGDRKIKIFHDKFTGATTDRPAYNRLKSMVKQGDVIVFDSVSRMSRDAESGFNDYMWLLSKGVDLVFLKEPHINTSAYKNMQREKTAIVATGNANTDEFIRAITNFRKNSWNSKSVLRLNKRKRNCLIFVSALLRASEKPSLITRCYQKTSANKLGERAEVKLNRKGAGTVSQ